MQWWLSNSHDRRRISDVTAQQSSAADAADTNKHGSEVVLTSSTANVTIWTRQFLPHLIGLTIHSFILSAGNRLVARLTACSVLQAYKTQLVSVHLISCYSKMHGMHSMMMQCDTRRRVVGNKKMLSPEADVCSLYCNRRSGAWHHELGLRHTVMPTRRMAIVISGPFQ